MKTGFSLFLWKRCKPAFSLIATVFQGFFIFCKAFREHIFRRGLQPGGFWEEGVQLCGGNTQERSPVPFLGGHRKPSFEGSE